MMDRIVDKYSRYIKDETLKSYQHLTERGMIFTEEDSNVRLMYNRSWFGTPTKLILPIPDDKKVSIVHTHIGSPDFSLADIMNFAFNNGLEWLCTSTFQNGEVFLHCAKVKTLKPRLIPSVLAYLECKHDIYGPRVEVYNTQL